MIRKLMLCLAVLSLSGLYGCASPSPAPYDEDPVLIAKDADRYCVRGTGTRLSVPAGQCAGPGRTYSSEDVRATGAAEVGGALHYLMVY